ncbi:nonribosomal peptide synthase [Aspergillus brasiliensis]|uniref:Nonribosomal peptide synthase n=1 Tax=Aspergillus brasiliensis TaxID=319629 RepID=A0A9W5YX29_9EURO|nr:nonribosomal peptide synthase [Aspergillus brasiliensis]GKZ42573.1 nonribosomal peptide synthase [Aspergillus brasiliensis]
MLTKISNGIIPGQALQQPEPEPWDSSILKSSILASSFTRSAAANGSLGPPLKTNGAGLSTLRISLPADIRTGPIAAFTCGALALVMSAHTGSAEFLASILPNYEQAPLRPGHPPTAFVPFYISVDWTADVQDFLRCVEKRLSIQHIMRMQHVARVEPWFRRQSTKSDLSEFHHGALLVDCVLEETEVQLTFASHAATVDPRVIQYVCQQYEYVLKELGSSGTARGKPVSDLRVVDMHDLRKIWTWNATVPEPSSLCIHDLFVNTVKKQPDALAISAHDGEWTYHNLDVLSTLLARFLLQYNIQETIVPIHMEKSKWTPVAQLGVMKAGAASVVMDTSLPDERLRTIIREVDPLVVLSSTGKKSKARNLSSRPVLVIGQDFSGFSSVSMPELKGHHLPLVSPTSRLYIVFTSGSTGLPKGATITHSNFASAIQHQQQAMKFQPGQRVFDFASYAFDVAWSNFLHTITAGGCLCIPSDEERIQGIPEALLKYKVNYVHLTPSVAWFPPENLPDSVKYIQFSGEELKTSLVDAFCNRATIINTYGPAECSVTTTLQMVHPSTSSEAPPIGQGVGSCPWVVSLDGTQLQPVGAVGELWIEGPIVGMGYLNDAAKTSAVFVDNPAWLVHSGRATGNADRRGRLYRTGDLVRYNREDGSLVFIGRKDSQVKIRGQRVELGEIEYHMRQCLPDELNKGLNVALDVIQPSNAQNPILVALLSPLKQDFPSDMATMTSDAVAVWDAQLGNVVPAYMVPAAYIPFERFPMTATGKVDRRSLRREAVTKFEDHSSVSSGTCQSVPTNDRETEIRQVWGAVLNLPENQVSTDVPFTRLGGDSITAMQVVSHCRARGICLTVSDVLRLRTIRALATRSRAAVASMKKAINHLNGEMEGQLWPVSPMQQLFFDAHPRGLNHYTQSFLLRVTRPITFHELRGALVALVKRHGMLRSRFQQRSDGTDIGRWEQLIVPATADSFAMAEHAVDGRLQEIVDSRQTQLDIVEGPVFAADLFTRFGEQQIEDDQTLLLSAHHIVIDLVSWRVIWHDLAQLLTGFLSPPVIPPSFREWCLLQRDEAQSLDHKRVLPYSIKPGQWDYWGIAWGDNFFRDSDEFEHILDANSTAMLLGPSNDALGTETLDIIIGSLVCSFKATFPERDVPPVFLEGHGREPISGVDIDVAETVGWFTTLHPLLVPATASDTITDLVRLAKDRRAQIPGKGRPYMTSRYYNPAGREAFRDHKQVELLLNYRGVFQQLESRDALLQRENRPGRVATIPEFGDYYQRMALVEINIVIEGGCARISTTMHARMRHHSRLKRWVDQVFPDTLRAAAGELEQASPRRTLADFPLLPISYAGLDALLSDVQFAGDRLLDIYPCTPVQEGILISEQKGKASYRNSWVWRCYIASGNPSPVSTERLALAWETVIRTHAVFATVFTPHPETGRYIQVLLHDEQLPGTLRIITAGSSSPTELLLQTKASTPVHDTEPQHAITICQGRDGEVACRLDMSHALIDASSIPVLLRHLAHAYDNQILPQDAPERPQFRNIVTHILQNVDISENLAYWTAHLSGAQSCLLPSDLSSMPDPCVDGSERYGLLRISAAKSGEIATYCRRQNITRAVFLQVAWALVLAQFTGLQEVCFGYVCSGRDTPVDRIEEVVGPLISMLIARIDLGATRLERVLTAVAEQSLEHLSRQHTSLAEIQHNMGSEGQLFNTAITVREEHQYGSESGLRLDEIREEDPHEYDVILSAVLGVNTTDISIQYRGYYISSGMASIIASGLECAIRFMMKPDLIQDTMSLHQAYFHHIAGVNESLAEAYWASRLKYLTASTFPLLPSVHYQPKPSADITHTVSHIRWSETYNAVALVQGAWAAVQSSHSEHDDVLFGTALSSHNEPVSRELASALPTRVTLESNLEISQVLDILHSDSTKRSYLNPLRLRTVSGETARASQFQTLIVITEPSAKHSFPLWDARDAGIDHSLNPEGIVGTRPVALTLQCLVTAGNIRLHAKFDSHVITGSLVTRMLWQFERALRWFSDPGHWTDMVSDIQTVSDQDLTDIWSWNAIVPEPHDVLVHDIFSQVAEQQPQALAISAWDGELTYRELDDLSSRLAFYLVHRLAVGPGILVPVYIEKSRWTPIAQLAVMKAGAATVLLDSTQPTERARTVTEVVKPKVVITSDANQVAAALLGVETLVVLDRKFIDSIYLDTVVRPVLPRNCVPSDLLYVVFTSGSTGLPKGALVSHANFAAAILHQQRALGYRTGLRVYDFVSYAFDVSWSNVLHSLTSGSCLCIPSDEERKNDIVGSLRASQATLVDLTPSVLRLINPQDVPQLRQVLLSGEPFTKTMLGDWAQHTSVLNTYGPAECSVKATMAPVNLASLENDIGCGEGLLTWVVSISNNDKLAPIGSVGELWLEGPLVGQGYLGDQEKTAAAFVNDPSWLLQGGGAGRPGRQGRLYRTGDLVRYDLSDDGPRLIFVGRRDSQIKIRGQRVELGEIETHIRHGLFEEGASEVHFVVDTIQLSDGQNPLLAAFVELADRDEGAATTNIQNLATALVDRLSQRLPSFMIPTIYIPVERIPVGPTGKTNRRLLKELGCSLTTEQIAKFSPGNRRKSTLTENGTRASPTSLETLILEVCAAVLNKPVARLSLDDNFFSLGGDSIDAMQLVGAARERGITLSVAQIFKQPTLGELSQVADSQLDVLQPSSTGHDNVDPFSLLPLELPQNEVRSQAARLCDLEADCVTDVFPCTPLQKGLLAMTMRRPGDYVLRQARRLEKHVDIARFRAAWEQIVHATPILRSRIVNLPEFGLVQVVTSPSRSVWENSSRDVNATLNALEHRPIELGEPLARFALVEDDASGSGSHFIWSLHHSVFDGWSLELIEKALSAFYHEGYMPKILPMQTFLRYIQRYSGLEMDEFWRTQFEGIEARPFFALPSSSFQPRSDHIMKQDIMDIHWGGKVTASNAIRAAWAILLSSYSGTTDAVFGVTVSGRQASLPGIEDIAAPLIATVPVRVVVNRGSTVGDLLDQVKVQAVDMIPFEQAGLQRIKQLNEACEQACEFQTLVLVQPEPRNNGPRDWCIFQDERNSANDRRAYDDFAAFNTYPLLLECQPQPHSVHVRISIDSRVVDKITAQRMGLQFEAILRQLLSAANQDQRVSEIQIASDQDLDDIRSWNLTSKGAECCVHDLFSQVVRKQPNLPAICAWDGEFTYGELDALSSNLALSLLNNPRVQQTGGRVIPLYFEKSKWMPVAQLGIMKAGGASVALDANLPLDRLRTIIELVDPPFVLSSTDNAEFARKLHESVQIAGEYLRVFSRNDLANSSLPVIDPSSTLYVVFTSGSTGIPKGVMISHTNFATAVHSQQAALELSNQSRVWDFVSYAFDVSWSNVLQTLCAGGCLCIPSEEERRHNPALSIAKMKVNYAHVTPTVARLLVGADLPDLHTMSFIGEPLRAVDVSYWQGKVRVLNTYGPAECTPVATVHVIEPSGDSHTDPSVGRGVGVETWVVDVTADHPKMAAIGSVGELWLGGPLVGQGYLKAPEKTAQVFVEAPRWIPARDEGAILTNCYRRLYRTGDMVRYNSDGTLAFVGRKDAQVKIRGQRVELGDIEHHVRRALYPLRLSQVVAELIIPAGESESLLVVFLEVAAGETGSITAAAPVVHSRLVRCVPSYMIPTAYIPLDELPITASGKTDRIKLRSIGAGMKRHDLIRKIESVSPRHAPANPTEIRVHGLMAKQLGVPPETLAMDDNFIHLGGDSISAMQFVSLAQQEGFLVTVGDVLSARNLLDIVSKMRTYVDDPRPSSTTPFAALGLGDQTIFFLENELLPQVPAEAGSLLDIWPVSSTQSVYIDDALRTPRRSYFQFFLDLLPTVDEQKLARSCQDMLNRHDIFRSIFLSVGDHFYQATLKNIVFDIQHQKVLDSEDMDTIFKADRATELSRPAVLGTPWVRVKFFIEPGVRTRLLLSLSHALYDAVTLGLLARDLETLYQGAKLPEAPSFARYAHHRVSRATEAHDYWRDFLSGASLTTGAADLTPALDNPPTVLDRTVSIPGASNGITTATVLTAACAIALGRVVGCRPDDDDIVFGRVVSTRGTLPIDFCDVLGPCINTIPVRIPAAAVTAKDDRQSILSTVQRQYIQGIPHDTASPVGQAADYGGFTFAFSSASVGCTTQFQNLDDCPALPSLPVLKRSVLDAHLDHDLPVAPGFLQIYGTPQAAISGENQVVNLKVTAGPAFSEGRVRQILDYLCTAFTELGG